MSDLPIERRDDGSWPVGARGPTKQKETSSRPDERLKRNQCPCFDPNRAKRDDIEGLMQLGPREQLFVQARFDLCARQLKLSDGLTQKGRLSRLDLNHCEAHP